MMTQQRRVKAVLEAASQPLTLHQIGEEIRQKFDSWDAETAISARIRDLRHDLESHGKTILSKRAGPGKHHHCYWIALLSGTSSCAS